MTTDNEQGHDGVQGRGHPHPQAHLDEALMHCARHGIVVAADLVIRAGALVKGNPKFFDETPLHAAARGGHGSMCQFLLDEGADVDPINSSGVTPLRFSAMNGHVDAALVLIASGANTSPASNTDGLTVRNLVLLGMTKGEANLRRGDTDRLKKLLTQCPSEDALKELPALIKLAKTMINKDSVALLQSMAAQAAIEQAMRHAAPDQDVPAQTLLQVAP